MAEKVAFLQPASFSVISICCSRRSSVISLTGAFSLSKKNTASPIFVSARFSSSVLYITLYRIPGFSQGRSRPCRYLPENSAIYGSLCHGMFNRKLMHRPAGHCAASGFPEDRRGTMKRTSAGLRLDQARGGVSPLRMRNRSAGCPPELSGCETNLLMNLSIFMNSE
ncbi:MULTISPECIES: hypothetical protein [unclassified Pantoea]|uniref:hypothetical protein n=1 Tax=unclassified Pantoea TaxID=2630326 RepID=UPI0025533A44|nr:MULTISPECIES: hypothetical protein [unclassified Pantoea]